jgi:hypothetical protein
MKNPSNMAEFEAAHGAEVAQLRSADHDPSVAFMIEIMQEGRAMWIEKQWAEIERERLRRRPLWKKLLRITG